MIKPVDGVKTSTSNPAYTGADAKSPSGKQPSSQTFKDELAKYSGGGAGAPNLALHRDGQQTQPPNQGAPSCSTVAKPGDTFWGLGQKYHTTAQTLMNLNPDTEPRRIQIGQTITLPAGACKVNDTSPKAAGPSDDVDKAVQQTKAAQSSLDQVQALAAKGNGSARAELRDGSLQADLSNAKSQLNAAVDAEITSKVGANSNDAAVAKAGQDIAARYAGDPAASQLVNEAVTQVRTGRQVQAAVSQAQQQNDPVKALQALNDGYKNAPQNVKDAILNDPKAQKIVSGAANWANQPLTQKSDGLFPQAQTAQAIQRLDQATQGPAQQQTTSGSGQPPADGSASGTGLLENTGEAVNTIVNPSEEIAKLNSDGDQVVMSMTAEGKLQVPVPVGDVPVGAGGKGQYGYGITVAQVGDQNPVYDVTFDKNLLGGATVEPPIPGIDPALELNFRTAGSVTMRFESQADATRAAEALQRLALEETVRDAGSAILPLPTGSNPASNPVPDSGSGLEDLSSTDPIADRVGPSDEDMAFLREHVTTYTSAVGAQERLKVAAKFANLGIEPRFDGNQWLTRTVTMPQDGQPGRVTYTLSGELNPSTKEKLTIGQQQFDQLEIGYVPQNIVDHGRLYGEVSMSWDVPADAMGPTVSGQPVPEIDALLNGDFGRAPDEISARFGIDHQTQSLTDLSRTDQRRLSFEVSTRQPDAHVGPVISNMLSGDLEAAFRSMGEDFTVTATNESVRRDGIEQQHEIGVEVADVAEGKVSLIAEIGLSDVTSRQSITSNGNEIADRLWGPQALDAPAPVEEAPEARPDNRQFAVVPPEGLNVRAQPSLDGQKLGAYRHGTFVDATGQRHTDETGRQWMEVRGLDAYDRVTQGWVDASYLQPHAAGGRGGTGRINPDLEAQGYEAHVVQPGDTVWDLAQRDGVNFNEMLRLNQDHLIDPGLIFPGDKVYIPGTGQPAPAEPPAQPEQPAQPADPAPSDSSGSGSESGSTGSSSGSSETGTTGSAPAPQQPAEETPAPQQPDNRPDLDAIRRKYQVRDEETTTFRPNVDTPFGEVNIPGAPSREGVPISEERALDSLGLFELRDLNGLASYPDGEAYRVADQYYPPEAGNMFYGQNDGHNDAFRHAYLSARMTQMFGVEHAEALATAHEALPGNPANREAMDLYNNELGRKIAQANPNASPDELAGLIHEAVENGEAIVIDDNGNLAWSDQVGFHRHGIVPEVTNGGEVLPGQIDAGELTTGS